MARAISRPPATMALGTRVVHPLFADVNGDGKQDLISANPVEAFVFPGNGDTTFQAPPATPVYGLTADVNNDGIADMVFSPPREGTSLAQPSAEATEPSPSWTKLQLFLRPFRFR